MKLIQTCSGFLRQSREQDRSLQDTFPGSAFNVTAWRHVRAVLGGEESTCKNYYWSRRGAEGSHGSAVNQDGGRAVWESLPGLCRLLGAFPSTFGASCSSWLDPA